MDGARILRTAAVLCLLFVVTEPAMARRQTVVVTPEHARSTGAAVRVLERSDVVIEELAGSKVTVREPKSEQPGTRQDSNMPEMEFLRALIGKWEGISRTWFEPGKLADESRITGEFVDVLDGRFVRHTNEGTIQGKRRRGEELIAFNSVTRSFQSSWVDDFHMSDAIMFSQGESTERGFKVRGEYDVGEGQPQWGWRTEYELVDESHLTITAYNIHPEGMEAKAVETIYQRAK